MEYYFCIFIRDLAMEKFYNINETIEDFNGTLIEAEKDLIVGRSYDIRSLSCLLMMRKNYPEVRIGFSQYIGLAKGLSKIAKFGEILISEEIEQQVIETFDITSLGMLSIEGMSSQILVCKIDQPSGELPLPKLEKTDLTITREKEIGALLNLLRVSKTILITGHTGSGKTTFINQLISDWEDKKIFRTFCSSYTLSQTFRPVTDIVTQILNIYGVESIEDRQKIIENKLQELEIVDIATTYLSILDFLELNEEESILEKLELKTRVEIIAKSIAEVVKRISWSTPIVIVIEDIENMDNSSCIFVQHLMEEAIEENACFLFSSSIQQVNISGLKEFELRNIDKKRMEDLIEMVTEERITLPATTAFHVLEYLRLYEEEKILFFYKQYCGETALSNYSLPFHDFKTIIKRRLDLLDEDKKEFLFGLAIAGVEISPDELPVDKNSMYLFNYFVERKYLVKHLDHYVFISPLLHEEIYNLVDDKQNRHAHLADYYRRIQGFEEKAAFHYQKAENHKKAIEFLMKSADLAIKKGGYESGIYYYNQALDLCQRQKDAVDLEILVALNEGLADVYRALGDEDKALKYYKVVLDSYKEILKE